MKKINEEKTFNDIYNECKKIYDKEYEKIYKKTLINDIKGMNEWVSIIKKINISLLEINLNDNYDYFYRNFNYASDKVKFLYENHKFEYFNGSFENMNSLFEAYLYCYNSGLYNFTCLYLKDKDLANKTLKNNVDMEYFGCNFSKNEKETNRFLWEKFLDNRKKIFLEYIDLIKVFEPKTTFIGIKDYDYNKPFGANEDYIKIQNFTDYIKIYTSVKNEVEIINKYNKPYIKSINSEINAYNRHFNLKKLSDLLGYYNLPVLKGCNFSFKNKYEEGISVKFKPKNINKKEWLSSLSINTNRKDATKLGLKYDNVSPSIEIEFYNPLYPGILFNDNIEYIDYDDEYNALIINHGFSYGLNSQF